MDCAICYRPIGLKIVQCSKPCYSVYCSKCWSKMRPWQKSHCVYCKRKFPLNKSDKHKLYASLVLALILFIVVTGLYPFVPFERTKKCEHYLKCKSDYDSFTAYYFVLTTISIVTIILTINEIHNVMKYSKTKLE